MYFCSASCSERLSNSFNIAHTKPLFHLLLRCHVTHVPYNLFIWNGSSPLPSLWCWISCCCLAGCFSWGLRLWSFCNFRLLHKKTWWSQKYLKHVNFNSSGFLSLLVKFWNSPLRSGAVNRGTDSSLQGCFINLPMHLQMLPGYNYYYLVNLLSLGSACSLRVIINYSALSSTSRQLGGLKDIRKHTIGINAPHYNNTSLMSMTFFYCDGYSRTRPVCSLIHYDWQMLLTVFNLTVLHVDINL